MDHSVLHIFSTSSPYGKSSKVAFASNVYAIMGSTLVCLYTSPTIILAFMNVRDSAWPLVNSIEKITVLWKLSPVGIKGTLIIEKVDIFTIAMSKPETISNTDHSHLTRDTHDAPIQIGYTKQQHQLSIRIYDKSSKVAEQWPVTNAISLLHEQSGVLLCHQHILWWFSWFVSLQLHPSTTVSYSLSLCILLSSELESLSLSSVAVCICILVSGLISIIEITHLLPHLLFFKPNIGCQNCVMLLYRWYLIKVSILASHSSLDDCYSSLYYFCLSHFFRLFLTLTFL